MSVKGRENIIIRTSVISILANVFLSVFKGIVGLLSHSIAITLDALNNLSDALSSIITIIGTKLASKAPDKKHPLGHGRVEYLSQLVVAAIVVYAGVTALWESIQKIIRPEAASYSALTLIVMAMAIVVKLFLGRYVKQKGEEVHSGSLVASGSDASFDAILSASALGSALIYILFHISLEAFVGALISVVIVKSGIGMVTDAVDDMLGVRVKGELTRGIREVVEAQPGVLGAYDLLLHNYGPDRYLGSVHIEVCDDMSARDIDTLTRRIQEAVYRENGVIITTVGIYSRNTGDDEAATIRTRVTEKVLAHDGALQVHGFYLDEERKDMRFDVIIGFECEDRKALYNHIIGDIKEMYPEYSLHVTLDEDVSD